MLDEPGQLGTNQKRDNPGTGEMAPFIDDQLNKGIAQVESRAILIAERETTTTEQTIDIVFYVKRPQIDRAPSYLSCPSLTGKGLAGSALVEVWPELDHGKRDKGFESR